MTDYRLEIISLFGPDGSGKSTLAKALAYFLEKEGAESDDFMDEGNPHPSLNPSSASVKI